MRTNLFRCALSASITLCSEIFLCCFCGYYWVGEYNILGPVDSCALYTEDLAYSLLKHNAVELDIKIETD